MRHHKTFTLTTRSWLARGEDRNDLFIKKHCARWLRRYMETIVALEEPDLTMSFWCLGQKVEELIRFLIERLEDQYYGEQKDALHKALGAPRDLPYSVLDALNVHTRATASLFLEELDTYLREIENLQLPGAPCQLERNLNRFAEIFELDQIENELCLIFYLMRAHKQADEWLDNHLELDRLTGRSRLRCILDLDLGLLNRILNGKLGRLGVLVTNVNYNYMEFSDNFLPYLLDSSAEITPDKLFRKALPPDVPLSYHLLREEEMAHMRALLGSRSGSPSHVLLYGPPGTGKTCFSRSLVSELGVSAYEVVKPTEGNDKAGAVRTAIMGCLNITNRGEGSVVIVDEADSILNTQTSWILHGDAHDKGWLNQIMEEPEVRMIWITNSIYGIEESVLRRFAFSLHFKTFNRAQRERLWDQVLRRNKVKRFFNSSDIKSLATTYKVSAGVMDMAVRKAAENYPAKREAVYEGVKLALLAHETLISGGQRRRNKEKIEANYSLEGLNIKGNVNEMIERAEAYSVMLRNDPDRVPTGMNLLFYGPPGTGKSELARYIAYRLDRELIVRRASDVLGPYVGMTEQAIAESFAQAEHEEAVLVIDEVDTMLRSRDSAEHSWEASFTNEFLVQMERFRGVLICTTNRLNDLDAACIRRFHEKFGFDYLIADGNIIFYQRFLLPLAAGNLDGRSKARLKKLNSLTPGDFKVVRDRCQLRVEGTVSHHRLVDQLVRETEMKIDHQGAKKLGF